MLDKTIIKKEEDEKGVLVTSDCVLNPLTKDTIVLKLSDLDVGKLDAGEVDKLLQEEFGDIISREKNIINDLAIASVKTLMDAS